MIKFTLILIKNHLSGGHAGATISPAEDSEADGGAPVDSRPAHSHARLAKSAAALLLIHWLEMHLISIQGFDWNVVLYFDG